jgi:hypothetical protein
LYHAEFEQVNNKYSNIKNLRETGRIRQYRVKHRVLTLLLVLW